MSVRGAFSLLQGGKPQGCRAGPPDPGYRRSRPGSDSRCHRPSASAPGSAAAPDPGRPRRPAADGRAAGRGGAPRCTTGRPAPPPTAPDLPQLPPRSRGLSRSLPGPRRVAAGQAGPSLATSPAPPALPHTPPAAAEGRGSRGRHLGSRQGQRPPGAAGRRQRRSPGEERRGGDPQPAAPHPPYRRSLPRLRLSAAPGACR